MRRVTIGCVNGQSTDLPRVARLRALLLRHRLDERLAAGADPSHDPALRARARKLESASTRESLAETLDHIGRGTDRRDRPGYGATAPVNGRAVAEATGAFARAVDALRDGSVEPQGIAQLLELLRDADGPLYSDRGEGSLARAIDHALEGSGAASSRRAVGDDADVDIG